MPTPCPMPVTVMESNNSELSMEPAWSYLAGDADPVITLIDGVHLEMLSSPKNRAEVLANVRAILNQPSLDGP